MQQHKEQNRLLSVQLADSAAALREADSKVCTSTAAEAWPLSISAPSARARHCAPTFSPPSLAMRVGGQADVLRSQLERREELLVAQRSAFYKELMLHSSYAALDGTTADSFMR